MKIKAIPSPYSNDQIFTYLRTINFFPSSSLIECSDAAKVIADFDPSLENLNRLVRCHLITFPFENLAIYYTARREVVVKPQEVFDRAVTSGKGFGSYCFGQNTLLKGILRGLNYRVYSCGGRVNSAPEDRGTPILGTLQHLVLIAQLPSITSEEQLYLVDVGFGGVFGVSALVHPIPLIDGAVISGSAPPEEHRIIAVQNPSTAITAVQFEGVIPDQWALQARRNPNEVHWQTLYHFSLTCEFFDNDVEFQSFAVSNIPGHLFTTRLVCVKFFEVEDDPEKLGRFSVVGDKIIKRIGENSEVARICKTERERVEALKELCGVLIEPEDVQFMRGRAAALPMD